MKLTAPETIAEITTTAARSTAGILRDQGFAVWVGVVFIAYIGLLTGVLGYSVYETAATSGTQTALLAAINAKLDKTDDHVLSVNGKVQQARDAQDAFIRSYDHQTDVWAGLIEACALSNAGQRRK